VAFRGVGWRFVGLVEREWSVRPQILRTHTAGLFVWIRGVSGGGVRPRPCDEIRKEMQPRLCGGFSGRLWRPWRSSGVLWRLMGVPLSPTDTDTDTVASSRLDVVRAHASPLFSTWSSVLFYSGRVSPRTTQPSTRTVGEPEGRVFRYPCVNMQVRTKIHTRKGGNAIVQQTPEAHHAENHASRESVIIDAGCPDVIHVPRGVPCMLQARQAQWRPAKPEAICIPRAAYLPRSD